MDFQRFTHNNQKCAVSFRSAYSGRINLNVFTPGNMDYGNEVSCKIVGKGTHYAKRHKEIHSISLPMDLCRKAIAVHCNFERNRFKVWAEKYGGFIAALNILRS